MSDDPFEEQRERIKENHADFTLERFIGWLYTKVARGADEGLTLKQAMIAVNLMAEDADRWTRLEIQHEKVAPIWLATEEARVINDALAKHKSVTGRVLRQSIRDRYKLLEGGKPE